MMPTADIDKLKLDKSATAFGGRRKRRRGLIAALLVAALLLALAVRLLLFPVVAVETVTVSLQYPSSTFTILNASGYVVAQRKAALAAKATGRLEWLGVEEGSVVRAGEVIARLESQDVEAAKAQASAALTAAEARQSQTRAAYEEAERNLARLKELFRQGIVSQADFDGASYGFQGAKAALAATAADVATARAALAAARVAVDYTRISAPFAGVVLTKNADVGDIVTPLGAAANAKASVVTIADLASLKVEVDVSESNIEKVKIGQPCEILLDALPQVRFPGVVHSVVPTADRSKATIMVKVGFVDRDTRVLPEMSAKVAFLERPVKPAEEQPRTVIPREALVQRGSDRYVYLVKGERVAAVKVAIVDLPGDQVEVTSGVVAGDKIALKPLAKLKDGSRVKVVQP